MSYRGPSKHSPGGQSDSIYSGLSNEQVHHGLLGVPAPLRGAQDEDGHGDDSSVAVLAGKQASGME